MCYVTITKIVVNGAYISFDIAMHGNLCIQWQVISMVHVMYNYTYNNYYVHIIYGCIILIINVTPHNMYVQIKIHNYGNKHTYYTHLTKQQNTLCQRNRIACIQCHVVQKYLRYIAIQSHTRVGVQSTLTLAAISRLTADTSPESAAWKRAFSSCTTCITILYRLRSLVLRLFYTNTVMRS